MPEVQHPCVADTSCITDFLTETDTGDPNYGKLIPRDRIDPDPCNILECRTDGLFVPAPSIGPYLWPDDEVTVASFVWTTVPPPSPGGPITVGTVTKSVVVPTGGCIEETAEITASCTPLYPHCYYDGDSAFWRFEVVSWQIGAATGGVTPMTTAGMYAPPSYPGPVGMATFTQTGPVNPGDTISITARVVFWGTDSGPNVGLYYAALATPAGPVPFTITAGARLL